MKELGEKRDKLKKSFSTSENQVITNNFRDYNVGCSSSSSTTTSISRSSSCTMSDYNVSVHKFTRTLQIEITAGVADEDPYPLSKTLNLLAQEGLDVVSCVSSMVNQRWIYVIYCEVIYFFFSNEFFQRINLTKCLHCWQGQSKTTL